ncbi:MAG: hypothetical protein CVV30_04390 [Methanomicrobiales archaeon HGW-Methanomicrobiales-1]|jgi:hypothetical protein|nr:MAG: hypothetical protein CVV30_04390 [Methanomicrobiales archaeon HGW-Methanomicrobiales-1]
MTRGYKPVVAIGEARRKAVIWGFMLIELVTKAKLPFDFVICDRECPSLVRIRRLKYSQYGVSDILRSCRQEIGELRALRIPEGIYRELWVRGPDRAWHRYLILDGSIEVLENEESWQDEENEENRQEHKNEESRLVEGNEENRKNNENEKTRQVNENEDNRKGDGNEKTRQVNGNEDNRKNDGNENSRQINENEDNRKGDGNEKTRQVNENEDNRKGDGNENSRQVNENEDNRKNDVNEDNRKELGNEEKRQEENVPAVIPAFDKPVAE